MGFKFQKTISSKQRLLLNRGVDGSRSHQSSPSSPSCSSSSASFCSHGVTMETPGAHTLPLLLPKPRPHKPCASTSPWFIFPALMLVYFVCLMCVHAHHLGRRVSSVRGTWVLWFASSSLWSAQWWPWLNRQRSNERFSVFKTHTIYIPIKTLIHTMIPVKLTDTYWVQSWGSNMLKCKCNGLHHRDLQYCCSM